MLPSEKLKLLTPNADGDRLMDTGNTICPFHHSLNGRGITMAGIQSKKTYWLNSGVISKQKYLYCSKVTTSKQMYTW